MFLTSRIILRYNPSSSYICHNLKISEFSIRRMLRNLAAVCQMTSGADKDENFKVVHNLVVEAKQRGASIAFLPEACDYICDNKEATVVSAEYLEGNTVKRYQELACHEKIWLSIGGFHEKDCSSPSKIHNTHIMINNEGKIVSTYRKIHLFDMDNKQTGVRLMESDYALKGSKIECPVPTPIGEVGLGICYDLRFPELALSLRNMGAKILTYPSAFTYQTGAAHWEIILRARAIETQCYVIAAAQMGAHNRKRVSWGHAMIVDPWGTIKAQCSEGTGVVLTSIDLNYLDKIRKDIPVANHRRTDLYPEVKPLNP